MSIQPPDPPGPPERPGAASRPQRLEGSERPADARPPTGDGAIEGEASPRVPADIVDFSAEARRLLRAREAAAGDPGDASAARAELIERLRGELAAGGYRVDPDAIARALAAAEDAL